MYLEASDLFNKRIGEDGRTFKARMTCGLEIIDSGFTSIGIYTGSNSADSITLGSTFSQRIEVEMQELDIFLSGKEWFLEMGLMIDDDTKSFEYIPIGYFTPEKPSTDNGKTSFKAYDRMLKLSGVYSCSLANPTTVAVLQDISKQTGVPIDTNRLAEIALSVPVGYTYREVLTYIAQLYGKFANVNRTGTIEFHWWTEVSDYKITSDNTNGFNHNEAEFVLQYLSFITGQDEDGNAITISVGEGLQGITSSNPFITESVLGDIYNDIGGFSYTVSNVNCPLGDIRLDPWDMIEVMDVKGTTYKVPLMALEFKYDGGVSASFSCVGHTETECETDYKGPAATAAERYKANFAKIEKLLVKTASIEYLESNLAKIDTAVIGDLFARSGVITNLQIVDGYVTGQLNGVKINADVITTGTLAVDRLLVTGKDSVVYQINVESSGLSATELQKEVYQKYLNGTDIVANSITATQIAAKTITSQEINVEELFASEITATKLTIIGDSTFAGKLDGATGVFSGSLQAESVLIESKETDAGQSAFLRMNDSQFTVEHIDKSISRQFSMSANVLDSGEYYFGTHIYSINNSGTITDTISFLQLDESGVCIYPSLEVGGNISCDNIDATGLIRVTGNIISKANVYIGSQDWSSTHSVITQWADSSNHNVLEVDGNGLTTRLGWAGSSSYSTVTVLRGRTCKYTNSSGTTTLSDVRLKENFTELERWETFYEALEPYACTLKTGDSGRYHMVFKAQQVEEALLENGLSAKDFAGLIKMKYQVDDESPDISAVYDKAGIKDGDEEYGLIYTEFVAMNTYMIQKLMNRVKVLENQISNMEVSGI